MLQLIFIMQSSQISPDSFDVKKNMLLFIFLFVNEYTLFVCIWSKHLKLYLRKWSLIQMSLKNIHFKTWIGLVLNIKTVCAWINHAVLCYSCMSLKNYREISCGWIFCFLSLETQTLTQFSIACSRLSICTGIKNQEQPTVHSHLNSTAYR